MNLAPLAQFLTALIQAGDNNTALALNDTNEIVSHDRCNRIIHTQRLNSVLTTLVLRFALTGGYLILVLGSKAAPDRLGPHDTILEEFIVRLDCVFKLSANSPPAIQARQVPVLDQEGAVL